MILGKWVADELEKPKSKSELIEQFRMIMPECEEREYKMTQDLDGISLLGYLDGFSESKEEIIEVKTGRKWNQKMVDNHGQLDFYALMYYKKYNKLPESIKLVWLVTEKDDYGEVFLTGEFKIFKREIKMRDILRISIRIKKADKEIAELYEFSNL